MSVQDLYEKMLINPKNRQSSSGSIKQPTPYDNNDLDIGPDPNTTLDDSVSPEERAFMAAVDKRVQAKNEGRKYDDSGDKLDKIEKDISEIKDLLVEMMKTHLQILENKK
jgi:hypothetical protein